LSEKKTGTKEWGEKRGQKKIMESLKQVALKRCRGVRPKGVKKKNKIGNNDKPPGRAENQNDEIPRRYGAGHKIDTRPSAIGKKGMPTKRKSCNRENKHQLGRHKAWEKPGGDPEEEK